MKEYVWYHIYLGCFVITNRKKYPTSMRNAFYTEFLIEEDEWPEVISSSQFVCLGEL